MDEIRVWISPTCSIHSGLLADIEGSTYTTISPSIWTIVRHAIQFGFLRKVVSTVTPPALMLPIRSARPDGKQSDSKKPCSDCAVSKVRLSPQTLLYPSWCHQVDKCLADFSYEMDNELCHCLPGLNTHSTGSQVQLLETVEFFSLVALLYPADHIAV